MEKANGVSFFFNFNFTNIFLTFNLEELQLQGSTVFDRFFKGKSADTCDAILVNNYSKEVLIYSIHRDGIIRCWNYKV